MEDMGFTVKTITMDGTDTIGYDSNFNITDGILYYGAEEISRDTEDLMDVLDNIINYCSETVIDIFDDNDKVIYHNEEFDDDFDEFEETLNKYERTLKLALGE